MISLARLKEERKRFGIELSKIEGLRVYPSEANYFLCELLGGYNSTKLAGELLEDNILIKDLIILVRYSLIMKMLWTIYSCIVMIWRKSLIKRCILVYYQILFYLKRKNIIKIML